LRLAVVGDDVGRVIQRGWRLGQTGQAGAPADQDLAGPVLDRCHHQQVLHRPVGVGGVLEVHVPRPAIGAHGVTAFRTCSPRKASDFGSLIVWGVIARSISTKGCSSGHTGFSFAWPVMSTTCHLWIRSFESHPSVTQSSTPLSAQSHLASSYLNVFSY